MMNEDEKGRYGRFIRKGIARIRKLFNAMPDDRAQLIELLRELQRAGMLDTDALVMMEGVLQMADLRVRDVMIPRAQMVTVSRDDPLERILDVAIRSEHSRFPVLADEGNTVAGILLAKDLLRYATPEGAADFSMRELLRNALFVPESKRLDVLLRQFRAGRNHIAIVVDEFRGIAGLVTIEDVIEQIVGEIEDEHDHGDESLILRRGNNVYTVKATAPVDEFNRYFSARLDEEDFDTVGGLVMHRVGHVPKAGEVIDLEGFRFEVVRADSRRVHLFRVRTPQATGAGTASDEAA